VSVWIENINVCEMPINVLVFCGRPVTVEHSLSLKNAMSLMELNFRTTPTPTNALSRRSL